MPNKPPLSTSKERRKVLIKKMIRNHMNDLNFKNTSRIDSSRNTYSKYDTKSFSKQARFSSTKSNQSNNSRDSQKYKKVKNVYYNDGKCL